MAERRTNNRVNQEDDKNSKFKRTKKKVCPFSKDKDLVLDYKNAEQLQRFITEKGKILPRRVTGATAKQQREITAAIKKARQVALLPYSAE